MEAKRAKREEKVGLESLLSCARDPKTPVESEDLMAKFKEAHSLCAKLLSSSAVLKPQLTKTKYAAGFIKSFGDSYHNLKTTSEILLTTMGSYQTGRCSKSISMKSIGNAAKAYKTHKDIVQSAGRSSK